MLWPGRTALLFAWILSLCGCGRSSQTSPVSSPPRAIALPPSSAPVALAAPDAGPSTDAAPRRRAVTLQEVGLEVESMDPGADPCANFYQYACGGWSERTSPPPGRARWSRFDELEERNREVIAKLLEGDAEDPTLAALQILYASCMDETAIDGAGITAIEPLLESARKVRDPTSLVRALAELHLSGVAAVFEPSPGPDLVNPDRQILFLDPAGLGLPDRDYYLIGREAHEPARAAYRDYVRAVFQLLGMKGPSARRAASDVLEIETALARAMKGQAERRMVDRLYNPMDRAGLAELAPHFDWRAYFAALGLDSVSTVNVITPRHLRQFNALIAHFQPSAWSHYLTWHIVNATASTLPAPFAEAQRTFARTLGRRIHASRREECLDAIAEVRGEALGIVYARAGFGGDVQEETKRLIAELRTTLGVRLSKLEWLGEAARSAAAAKLDRLEITVGAPAGRSVPTPSWLHRATYAANVLAARSARTRALLDRVGAPTDRRTWEVPAHHQSPTYNWLANQLTLPAGFLQEPFFSPRHNTAVNLGAMGTISAHELTHAFDDRGAMFDGQGKLIRWWDAKDTARFTTATACLIEQLADQEVSPGVQVDGRRAFAETLADLGGLRIAFAAHARLSAADGQIVTAGDLSEDQQFFVAFAQARCERAARGREANAPAHTSTPARVRVNVAVSNLPAFSRAFACAEGAAMRRASPCAVW